MERGNPARDRRARQVTGAGPMGAIEGATNPRQSLAGKTVEEALGAADAALQIIGLEKYQNTSGLTLSLRVSLRPTDRKEHVSS